MRTSTIAALPLALALMLGACGGQAPETGSDPNMAASGEEMGGTGNGAPDAAPPPQNGTAPQQPGENTSDPQPAGEVTLSASPTKVGAGATMTLTLRNGSKEDIGYNLCTSTIETSGGKAIKTDRVCTMELRTLAAGKTADYSYDLPGKLDAGSYRFVAQVEQMQSGGRNAVRSNGFEVRP